MTTGNGEASEPRRLSGAAELPEEIQETLDQMRADPNYGVRWGRLSRKTQRPADWPQVEEAELEEPDSDEESLPDRHWLLITGLGIVALGFLVRWWWRHR